MEAYCHHCREITQHEFLDLVEHGAVHGHCIKSKCEVCGHVAVGSISLGALRYIQALQARIEELEKPVNYDDIESVGPQQTGYVLKGKIVSGRNKP